jgi:hypothetical protein
MSALTAGRATTPKGKLRRQMYLVAASTTIYAGGMVCINATGYAVPAANTAGLSDVVGIATATVDNADGADGEMAIVVEYGAGGAFMLDAAGGISQADVGRDAFVSDDQTVTDAAASTNRVRVGKILEFIDEATNKVWVIIDNVQTNNLAAGAVATADLADDSVTFAKAAVFVSTEQTGNGAQQSVAHGLAAAPAGVLIAVTEDPAGSGFDVAEGTHTATNVLVTVTTGVKYKVFAWA